MDDLDARDFREFFRELYPYDPFPWQERLALRVCAEGWPEALDLPTASGKTACIDIAVFAMAVRGQGPRRVFFVVDRRVVVDAAFERMKELKAKLSKPKGRVSKMAGDRLRAMSGGGEPLETYEMRGGIYRDDSWVRSPLQPTLIASTVDQVGSRLLFRGYGAWDKTWPIHAGLVGNDALLLLDEAHCSRAFAQTVEAIDTRYRRWARTDIAAPFAFVEMTATPAREVKDLFSLAQDDYQHPRLRERLYASKPARLIQSKARVKDLQKLAHDLANEALALAKEPGLRRIAVMVNRVKTARLVYEELKKAHRAHLLIGRMRPIDRAALPADLNAMVSGAPRTDGDPVFVVATQCLEVGADLDFDGLVTECASIDALLQRFGRLDRTGALSRSGVTAQGAVVVSGAMTDPKYEDPIYGGALAKTWNWLTSAGMTADFAICSESGERTVREKLNAEGERGKDLRSGAPPAPMLLPAHLDALVQTSPRPALEPDIQLFLHGKTEASPDVQVIWRADMDLKTPWYWKEIVALCPPVSSEAMAVPIWQFKDWLTGRGDDGGTSADVEGVEQKRHEPDGEVRFPVLRWRGDESQLVIGREAAREGDIGPERIRPGDTLILAAASGGWGELGHVPGDWPTGSPAIDAAEEARAALRRGGVVRLHPALLQRWPDVTVRQELVELSKDPSLDPRLVDALRAYGAQGREWLRRVRPDDFQPYPSEDGTHIGWVVSEKFMEADSGGDESSTGVPIALRSHLDHVTEAVREMARALIADDGTRHSLEQAARAHDTGKADQRFQALLRGGDPSAAQFSPVLLAKGTKAKQSKSVRNAQWRRSGLPDGFRHELISLLLVGGDEDYAANDLALHLIATHHGRCRPFAPVVVDGGAGLSVNGWRLDAGDRGLRAAHRLDSGAADRFWRLTRRFGWWGLAYLECVMRLSDWKASGDEAEKKKEART